MQKKFEIPANVTVNDLARAVSHYAPKKDVDLIYLAYEFAAQAHTGQKRLSGDPYITHPLSTAFILAKMRIDTQIVIAALLHDVPEDTQTTIEEIEADFGVDVASMVRGITKLGKLKYRGVERYIENLRKMFVAMAEDVRVMIIKFADRIHNLLTLETLPSSKRYRIALESLEIFAPIANRLGMGEFKGLLEDLSFPYVFPKDYKRVEEVRARFLTASSDYIPKIKRTVQQELKKVGVEVLDIHGREKQLFSLYQKLVGKDWDDTLIYDILAIRLVVNTVSDCYAALGIIHKLWRPLKGRIKDYIAQPKPNGYQSLHTTVFCDDRRVEFQIRTPEMHEEAEYGAAAHWHYDERGMRMPAKDLSWAQELAIIQKDILKNISDLEELKVDVFKNRIFVFTPHGDVIDLPEDATPIDFAYHIHTEVGNKCNGAKVNDQLVSLDTPLKSGDVVDIIVSKNRKNPNPDWMKIAKTRVAKAHIKNTLHKSHNSWLKSIFSRENGNEDKAAPGGAQSGKDKKEEKK